MDQKLFKKTYIYICSSCGIFSHTKREYCEGCGMQGSIGDASKQDYRNAKVLAP